MHRTALVIGVLLIFTGLLLLNQGSQFLVPIAENTGLTSHYARATVILPPTLFSVPSSNYTFTMVNLNPSVQVTGSLQVSNERQVAFYVMNEGNFSLWRQGRPSAVLIAQPVVISYNFTFTPSTAGHYFFIFDNQDNGPRTVIFNLNTIENVTVLSQFVQYADLEVLLIGIVLTFLSLKGGKKERPKTQKIVQETTGWKCKFCGALNTDPNGQFCTSCERSRA
ncbi:MAG TPA: hypothetical protein VLV18_00500 [Terriglobales bacterium]|nr:hypothetical protein [Terriglobales bacterium]